MAHGDTVADRNCIEFKWSSAGLANSLLYSCSYLVQMNVARHYLAKAVGDTDERLINIGVTKAAGVKQAPVGSLLKTLFYRVAYHIFFLSVKTAHKVNLEA
jgi:hypothetical protein